MEDKGKDSDATNGTIESRHPKVLYPFVPGKYGLNLTEKKTPFKGFIESGSGKKVKGDIGESLDVAVDHAWVRIFDAEENLYFMSAELNGDTVRFSVYTKKITGERHPDFRAKYFIEFSITHFKKIGRTVRRIESQWGRTYDGIWSSDTYDEYLRIRNEGNDREEAVRKTWSGKIFEELGFTEIEDVDENDEEEEARVVFKIPGEDKIVGK